MSISPLQTRERIPPVHPQMYPDQAAPQSDRRSAQRIRQPFQAEIAAWNGSHTGPVFKVTVQDISTTGLRIEHSSRLEPGKKYMLEVPRPGQRPIGVVFTVVHCDETDGGGEFSVQLQPDDVMDLTTRAALRQYVQPERASNTIIAAVITSVIAAAATTWFLIAQ